MDDDNGFSKGEVYTRVHGVDGWEAFSVVWIGEIGKQRQYPLWTPLCFDAATKPYFITAVYSCSCNIINGLLQVLRPVTHHNL